MFRKIILAFIWLYQHTISPDHGILRAPYRGCRFYPTCSDYTSQAINKYGVIKGVWWGVKRILRCHPFNEGGYDPLK